MTTADHTPAYMPERVRKPAGITKKSGGALDKPSRM